MNILKLIFLSLYNVLYYGFEKWINATFLLILVASGLCAIKAVKSGIIFKKKLYISIPLNYLLLYVMFLIINVYYGYVIDNTVLLVIQVGYYLLTSVMIYLTVGILGSSFIPNLQNKTLSRLSYANILFIELIGYFTLLIPIIVVSRYVFPLADDYSFSFYTHQSWLHNHSLFDAVLMACRQVYDAYFDWQGTFSSIFLMALQPGSFSVEFYHCVPLFFVAILSISSYFFLRILLVYALKVDKIYTGIITITYIILIIQYMPYKAEAFFWFNGAIHYVFAHCIFLILAGHLLNLYIGRHRKWNLVGAILASIYIGGTNYVTALETFVFYITIICVLLIRKEMYKNKKIALCGLMFLFSFLMNVLAPGNFAKYKSANGIGFVNSIICAFKEGTHYMFGEWIHWSLVAVILFIIPIWWKIVGKVKISFKYPLLVALYSYCFVTSMFAFPLFSIGTARVGRFLNVIYLIYILLLFCNIGYFIGWVRKRLQCIISEDIGLLSKGEARYYICLIGTVFLFAVISAFGEPQQATSAFAAKTLYVGEAKKYAETYEKNWEILETTQDNVVTIENLPCKPELFISNDMSQWNEGIRLFFNKDKVIVR